MDSGQPATDAGHASSDPTPCQSQNALNVLHMLRTCSRSRVVYAHLCDALRAMVAMGENAPLHSSHPIEKKALIVERMQAIDNLQHVRDVRG